MTRYCPTCGEHTEQNQTPTGRDFCIVCNTIQPDDDKPTPNKGKTWSEA